MKMGPAAESPDAYVKALSGWSKPLVKALRAAMLAAARFEEQIKWGHLVYISNGPVLLIRAEEERVLFGFWRGKRLRDLDGRLKASGKYEMATITFVKSDVADPAAVRKLVKAAVALNRKFGDPTVLP
jgi:hypothetical protein